jgi:superfamily I DNA and RNA helicase
MKQNYKIIRDEEDRFDIVPTSDPHDDILIFDSFRNCKKEIVKLIYIDIERLEKKIKLRVDDLTSIRRLFIKNFKDVEGLLIETEEVETRKEDQHGFTTSDSGIRK